MTLIDYPSVATQKTETQILLPRDEDDGEVRFADGLCVSEEEFWRRYYHDPDLSYEWNNGILEAKPMADLHSAQLYRWFLRLLEEYLSAHPIATIIGLEIGFRLALPHKTSIRRPDLAVYLHSNPVIMRGEECTYHGIFDLCIEFLSDSTPRDVRRDTVIKKSEYCQAGVHEYFILDRKGQKTAFYRLTPTGTYTPIPSPAGIIQSAVLPGFQFRVADLYERPSLRTRINDRVYNSFILSEYQAERQRADTLRQRAEAERQRAETERQRAEAEHQERLRLAAMLETLGIDPETGRADRGK